MSAVIFYVIIAMLVFGANNMLWASVGGIRWACEATRRVIHASGRRPRAAGPPVDSVAVLIAAHNEAAVIEAAIASAARLVSPERIFIASDGSTDETVMLAQAAGAQVLDIQPNRGKAGALAAGVQEFDLAQRFQIVLILDADTELDRDYLITGLPLFADPEVAVVAGRATTQWHLGGLGLIGRMLLMHRERTYVIFQRLVKYGQGFAAIDAITIAPGFASMYRAPVLKAVEMNPPGLVIEDFNMTFEIHRHRLGRIAFHPGAAVARTQDPVSMHDYAHQMHRWALGFWQTVRLHRLWHRGFFWLALTGYCLELVISSLALLATPIILVLLLAVHGVTQLGLVTAVPAWLPAPLPLALAVIVPDLVLTCAMAAGRRKPTILASAPGYLPLRMLDAWLCLASLAASYRTTSNGRWTSPARRIGASSPALTSAQP